VAFQLTVSHRAYGTNPARVAKRAAQVDEGDHTFKSGPTASAGPLPLSPDSSLARPAYSRRAAGMTIDVRRSPNAVTRLRIEGTDPSAAAHTGFGDYSRVDLGARICRCVGDVRTGASRTSRCNRGGWLHDVTCRGPLLGLACCAVDRQVPHGVRG